MTEVDYITLGYRRRRYHWPVKADGDVVPRGRESTIAGIGTTCLVPSPHVIIRPKLAVRIEPDGRSQGERESEMTGRRSKA